MKGKKIMGLPVAVWLGVAAAGLLLGIYLRRKGSTSSNVAPATSYPTDLPSPISQPPGSIDNGVAGGGLSPDSGAGVDPSVFNDLLSNEGALIGQLGSLTDAIGAMTFSIPSSGGSGASGDGKKAGSSPLQTTTPAKAPTKKQPKAKPPAAHPAQIHYFTYKKDVHLGAGQKLHFTKGKGYYAA